jgi:sulfur relay (sulfurtransferase) DsrF/TusC family protein
MHHGVVNEITTLLTIKNNIILSQDIAALNLNNIPELLKAKNVEQNAKIINPKNIADCVIKIASLVEYKPVQIPPALSVHAE